MARLRRVQDRSTFASLRRDGVRRRVGPLTFTRIDPPPAGPSGPSQSGEQAPSAAAVAFAIGRPVGTAVVRNRLRRRLRAVIAAEAPRPGTYLVSAGPAASALSDLELREHVHKGMA